MLWVHRFVMLSTPVLFLCPATPRGGRWLISGHGVSGQGWVSVEREERAGGRKGRGHGEAFVRVVGGVVCFLVVSRLLRFR